MSTSALAAGFGESNRGYCMMIGGTRLCSTPRSDLSQAWAPGTGDKSRAPGGRRGAIHARAGLYIHACPVGRGHFVKKMFITASKNMADAGLCRGFFDILKNANIGAPFPAGIASSFECLAVSPKSGRAQW